MPTGVPVPPSPLEFSSRDGSLWVNGAPLILKGINWYGFETEQGAVHGLYAQPISYFMELLSSNDFNAVRLPLDLDFILNDREHGFILPETTHEVDETPSPPPPYWANSSAPPPLSRSAHPSASPPSPNETLIHLHRTQPAPPLRRKLRIAPAAKKEFDGRLFVFLFVALALFPGAPLMVGIVAIVWRWIRRRRLQAEAASTSTDEAGDVDGGGGGGGGLKATQSFKQAFGPAELLGVTLVGLALLTLAGLAALRLTSGLQQGLGSSPPELEWDGGDAAQRGDLHQLGACNIYKAASPMVTDAWCLSSCKAGSCPKDLCEKRPTPTDICHTPPSPLMQNTSLELLDVRHTGLEPRPS
jgi:hypothetical protein